MTYELTETLGLRKPVRGTGEQYDSDVYSGDLQKIDDAIASDRERLDALEGGDGLVAADITDSTTVGRGVITASSAANAQTAIGGTTVGRTIFTAADAGAAQDAIGGTTVGKSLLTASSVTAAREALRIFVRTTPGSPQTGDVRTRDL